MDESSEENAENKEIKLHDNMHKPVSSLEVKVLLLLLCSHFLSDL